MSVVSHRQSVDESLTEILFPAWLCRLKMEGFLARQNSALNPLIESRLLFLGTAFRELFEGENA